MRITFFERHSWIRDVISMVIFVACVIAGTIFINSFIFRSFSVVGPSMETTLYTGDRLIVNRIPVTIANIEGKSYTPSRGQIIVFKNPQYVAGGSSTDEYIVKRVIAFGGEHVVLKNGKFTVYNDSHPNGLNPDDYAADTSTIGSPINGSVDEIVPKGELFVVGDHRQGSYSYDSRCGLGTIPLYDVVGPVAARIFPITKIRSF